MANFKFVFDHMCGGEAGVHAHTLHTPGPQWEGWVDEMIVVCVEGSGYYSIEGRGPQSVSETTKLSLLYVKQGKAVSVQHSLFEQSTMLDLL